MSEQTNLDLVKQMYAAFGRGDVSAMQNLMAPDVEWEHAGPAEIPWAGSFRTSEDVISKFLGPIAADADFDSFEPRSFVAQDDNVVVLGHEKLRSKRTGRSYEAHWAHAFTIAEGKIIKFREYSDTAAQAAAFGK